MAADRGTGTPLGVPSFGERDDWPIHRPGPAWEAPIPGVHWYGGCEPGYPRVNPETGRCEGCGEQACPRCGREGCGSQEHPAFRCPCPEDAWIADLAAEADE